MGAPEPGVAPTRQSSLPVAFGSFEAVVGGYPPGSRPARLLYPQLLGPHSFAGRAAPGKTQNMGAGQGSCHPFFKTHRTPTGGSGTF